MPKGELLVIQAFFEKEIEEREELRKELESK